MNNNSKLTPEEAKARFLEELKKIKRDGIEKLAAYLENKTDFFTAPASTRFHLCEEGGLCKHSLNVYDRLLFNLSNEETLTPKEKKMTTEELDKLIESATVVALLHDICKTNYYEVGSKNVKTESGEWQKVPYYKVKDNILGYGHGEESVYILSSFIKLSREEAFAIRFHMGDFEDQNTSRAFNNYPLSIMLHIADLEATYIDERI